MIFSQGWTIVSSRRIVGSKSRKTENNNRDNKRLKYTILGRLRDTIKAAKAASQIKIRLEPIIIKGTPQLSIESSNASS